MGREQGRAGRRMAMAAESAADRRRAMVHKNCLGTDPHTPSSTFHLTLVRWFLRWFVPSFRLSFQFISPRRWQPTCLIACGRQGSNLRQRVVASRAVGVASLDVARPFPTLHFCGLAPKPHRSLNLNECRALHARCTHGIQQPRNECHDCNVVHTS